MLPIRCDLVVRSRNVRFVWVEPFLDGLLPYDFTGHDVRMQARSYPGAGGGAVLTLANVGTDIEGLRFVKTRPDAVLDGLVIAIDVDTLRELPGLNLPAIGGPHRFAYDLLFTPPDKPEAVLLTGDLILFPGVTV